jgi:hypothetical protein
MTEGERGRKVSYVTWVFCKDKQGKLGYHQKLVTSRNDSDDFLRLVCLRCKYLRACDHCGGWVECVFGHALRYKPCRNFRANECAP